MSQAKAKKELATLSRTLSSFFWKVYEEELRKVVKRWQKKINNSTDVHEIYRGQGGLQALGEVARLPDEVEKVLIDKAGN